jgi:hypothetical protein
MRTLRQKKFQSPDRLFENYDKMEGTATVGDNAMADFPKKNKRKVKPLPEWHFKLTERSTLRQIMKFRLETTPSEPEREVKVAYTATFIDHQRWL